jgi:hypothetical protein
MQINNIPYPFKSKLIPPQFAQSFHREKTVQDYRLKPLKAFYRPYFSPHFNTWEIDLVFFAKDKLYLFAINVNTKFLLVYPIRNKNTYSIIDVLNNMVRVVEIDEIRGDGEKAWAMKDGRNMKAVGSIDKWCKDREIRTYFTNSSFTNHNRVVDRVIRTIRDCLGGYEGEEVTNKLIQTMVNYYNNTPHIAYQNVFSPMEVQNNKEIEAEYIEYQRQNLEIAETRQRYAGMTDYKVGNILLIHLDLAKTQAKFDPIRRNFNHIGEFQEYLHGNVVCRIIRHNALNQLVQVPIFYTMKISEDLESMPIKYKNYFKTRQ